ncbi:cation:proton antiporter domain-containing protein [Spongiivirga citrea]|uniref:Sodium:proton exchanger n=1 Tax=Spongiivirga citrea TaxID=1481457 RepID=A0A6M0CFU4_9FLAO|nr:cation:proton antiporter [Spongiivirga citrea]NER15743.1 sodium:proton exchanger [Spongiivirga citrea]
MDILSAYNLIIELSVIIIISFLFDRISKKTNVPSVLMLIALGIIIQYLLKIFDFGTFDFFPILEFLGIVGLIMIVLEAALDLKLEKSKIKPIVKSLIIALISLVGSAYIAALILFSLIDGMTMMQAWLYATPLSILSSAVIIPSVANLKPAKREFHIYEGTFSDILGIMMFYLLIEIMNPGEGDAITGFSISFLVTVVFSIIISYIIILVFQRIERQAKLFLLIAVLLLLYALGKKLHLSSLIIILIFGLILSNTGLFFKGKLAKFLKDEIVKDMYHELHMITAETAFVVRTLFFVVFGLSIVVTSLLNLKVALISILVLASIFLIRWVVLRVFIGKDIRPQLFIAPRGLITVLLFYAIPANLKIENFEPGILLFVIIGTSLIMTYALIDNKKREARKVETIDQISVADRDEENESFLETEIKEQTESFDGEEEGKDLDEPLE